MSADDKTLDLLRRLVDASPGDVAARAHLAELLLGADRPQDALALLDAAPSPAGAPEALLRGRVLAAIDPSRAIEHLRAWVAADRRCAPAHLALARLHRARGAREDARHHYGIAVVLDPKLEDAEFDDWIHGADEAPVAAHSRAADPADEPEDDPADGPTGPASDSDVPSAEDLDEQLKSSTGVTERPPDVTFADVGGMEELKEQIRMRVVYPFRNPEVFKKFHRRPGGGMLLYGPPGCGKTHLARATAGECGARLVSIGISEILSRWLGESEQRLAEVFESARRRAPTVLFIDELDALGMERRESRGSALQTLVNQLLTEMDGVGGGNTNVLVLAATNAPWNVDAALRRPGRFDRIVFVPPPDAAAREAIFRLHLAKVPHAAFDVAKCIKATKNFSGADLRAIVENAADEAIQLELRTGKPVVLTEAMIRRAIERAKPTTLEWLETARRYASYSNRGGQYDDVAKYFEEDR